MDYSESELEARTIRANLRLDAMVNAFNRQAKGRLPAIKKAAGGKRLVATAGGIRQHVVKTALQSGADIVVVGRAITASKNIKNSAEQFIEEINNPEIDQFRIMTDF